MDDIPFVDSLEDQHFVKATKFIELNTSSFPQNQLLSFYGLYKQATVGPCTTNIPGILHPQARAKWYAWNKLHQLDKSSAKLEYVKLLDELQPDWDSSRGSAWVSVSRPKRQEEDECIDEEEEHLLTTNIKDSWLEGVRHELRSGKYTNQLNKLDKSGLGIIHWAADRGDASVLRCILQTPGINVNLPDIAGQTALHYACSCDNYDCVKLLLMFNADRGLGDENGTTCIEVALCEKIRELLKDDE
ncbi:uncharacterized protein LOC131213978 [Anopheles bellator]|uniref:uncharacterized protein LOC131213978 n=1 Tax=Anopheles bellator TaxID=139047 RepID=UPI002648E967|nr:uncharacterized protein LOC131213978 [Anopheles bellator]